MNRLLITTLSLVIFLLSSAFVGHTKYETSSSYPIKAGHPLAANYFVDALGNRIIKSTHKSHGCYYSVRVSTGMVTCQKINF